MHEPSLRTSRVAIACGLAAAITIGAGGFWIGRATSSGPVMPDPRPEPVDLPTMPSAPSPVLQRADLIAAAGRAADSHAAGLQPAPDTADLAGRRFELVMPFGCDGQVPADSGLPLQWQYDDAQQTLRIQIQQAQWNLAEWPGNSPEGTAIQGQGFWIDRPWTSSENCSASRPAAVAPEITAAMPEQSLAIVQFASQPSPPQSAKPPKLRPLSIVKRLAPDRLDATRGFRMRLTGRIRSQASGAPVQCMQRGGGSSRPVCVIAASFEELSVEIASTSEQLATWSLAEPR